MMRQSYVHHAASNRESSIGWAILGFLIPIVGLILWLVWADEKPESAKMSGIGALASILLSIVSVFFVLSFMFI